ncbi:putative ribonuclease H-like domain-containing protein [Tanacetum coccineum]
MTPAQQKEYMSTYIKNQEGGYSIKQLKSLLFEQVIKIFETTMRKLQSFVPMGSELEVQRLKRAKFNNVTTTGPKAVVSAAIRNGEMLLSPQHARFGDQQEILLTITPKIVDHTCLKNLTMLIYKADSIKIDGEFVAFGGSPKGGKITGKGKIKTGKLDFEDVYFVKELKFNLFSVSQMYDKKSVLFTKTECLALYPDYKLLDESQVLLKDPKHDSMYRFDLKNVVPSGGLNCLFAKAKIDESNLWHRRLSHINFKTMNKLVRRNLVRGLPSKLFENDHTCVAYQKGKQHKASCKTKLVSSISQPLQILHMDLFGPTFVRSINHKIYCLVVTDDYSRIKREFSVAKTPQQNGVCERKNRTLIEADRTMLADSLLLTTFWAEAVSIGFLWSGPDWLFDIDLLTNSMNYEPTTAGNQTNKNAELKDALLSDAVKKTIRTSKRWVKENAPSLFVCWGSFDNADDLPTDPLMPDLEDTVDLLNTGIFSGAYDDEDEGAEVDLNNLETTMNIETMKDELLQFSLQKVWRLVDLPKGKHAIGTKWVYRNKKDERGIVVRNKARLMDVKSAFLYGIVEEEVYVCQPPGFEDPQFTDKVYKVEKALYGLHQAPKAWYETLSTYLLENEFRRGIINKILFIKKDKGDILLVQVMQRDDGIFISQDKPDIMFVVSACARFQLTPNVSHLHVRYLKGQPKLGLCYTRDSPFDLEAFSDSDYAGASLDRKSTTGDETIYKEWEDRMERAATTTSSLEAKQDSGNINRTQYPWQHLMKPLPQELFSIDPVNILGSGEDSMKLKELMELCTMVCLPANMKYCDQHNMVALLEKINGSEGFHQIVDFLNASHIRFALSENPTIYDSHIKQFWQTATINTLDNGEQEITASVDGHVKTVIIASVRKYLQLADAGGLSSLPNTEIFEQLSLMAKLFSKMRRVTKGYSGEETPLFATMLVIDQTGQGEGSAIPVGSQYTPLMAPSTEPHPDTSAQSPITEPHTSSPQLTKPPTSSTIRETIRQEVEIPQSNFPTQTPVAYEATFTGVDVVHGGAATTDSSIDAGHGSGNIPKVKKLEQTVKISQARRRSKIVVFEDEDDLVAEDPSKQGRSLIEEMDLDAGISLVPPQVSTAGPEVTTADAKLKTASTFVSTATPQRHADTTVDDLTLAATLMEIRSSAAKAKGKAIMQESGDQLKSAATAKASLKWIKLSHQVNETDRSALVELVNQRKKFFAQQRAKAKRNKPMTPAQQKEYMSNYIKNQEGVGKVHRQENRQTRRFTLKTQEGIGKLSELETIEKLIRFFANGKGNLIEMTWLRALDLGKEAQRGTQDNSSSNDPLHHNDGRLCPLQGAPTLVVRGSLV